MIWLLLLALIYPLQPGPVSAEKVPREFSNPPGHVGDQIDDALQAARYQFAAAVKNGRLKGFDEEHGQVVFKSLHSRESDHRPGPMEDDVIAATLRSHIAATAGLQKHGIMACSDAGRVRFTSAPSNPGALANLIVLALDIDGVSVVRADLPPVLRAPP